MGQKEKLIKKLKTKPKDFTFDEAESLLKYLGYSRLTKEKPAVPASCLSMNNMRRFCFINLIREKNCWNIR